MTYADTLYEHTFTRGTGTCGRHNGKGKIESRLSDKNMDACGGMRCSKTFHASQTFFCETLIECCRVIHADAHGLSVAIELVKHATTR